MKLITKGFTSTVLLTGLLSIALASVASAAKPPSGDSDPSDLDDRTVSTEQIINPHPR